jgi:hypothetical protein
MNDLWWEADVLARRRRPSAAGGGVGELLVRMMVDWDSKWFEGMANAVDGWVAASVRLRL